MNTTQVVKDDRTITVEAHHGGWAVITITVNGTPVPFSVDPEHRRLLADALGFGINDQKPRQFTRADLPSPADMYDDYWNGPTGGVASMGFVLDQVVNHLNQETNR